MSVRAHLAGRWDVSPARDPRLDPMWGSGILLDDGDRKDGAMKDSRERDDSSRTRPAEPDRRDVLELWMALSRFEWKSLVLVPTDPASSPEALARWLAEIGKRLTFGTVNAISVDSLEYGSALALADLQQHVVSERPPPAPVIVAPPVVEAGMGAAPPAPPPTEALMRIPPTRLIISIPPVIREPLGIPAAREADAVIVCLRLGTSRVPDLRRTVQLIGREKIVGTVLLR